MKYGKCFLSDTYGLVERHHIFGGALREKSELYGLVVELSPWMHREGPKAAHRCGETARKLKRYGQRKIMIERGWTVERFILEFGRNYLADEELERVYQLQKQLGADPEEWELEPTPTWTHEVTMETPGAVRFTVTAEVLPF